MSRRGNKYLQTAVDSIKLCLLQITSSNIFRSVQVLRGGSRVQYTVVVG